MTIRIENYREQPPTGSIVAIFDIYIPETTEIKRNLKLVRSKNGSHFISFPSFSVEDEHTGEKRWYSFYEYGEFRQKQFTKKILEELSSFVKG